MWQVDCCGSKALQGFEYRKVSDIKKIKENLVLIPFFALLWVGVSSTVQALSCPEMTQAEVMLHIPKSFICDFETCE